MKKPKLPLRIVQPQARIRSAGSDALSAVTTPGTELADRLGVDVTVVSRWKSGERVPTVAQRRKLFRLCNIPADSWARPPGNPPTLDRASLPPVTAESFRAQSEALFAEANLMKEWSDRLRETDVMTSLRLGREANQITSLIMRLSGATIEMSEERAARLPAVRRLLERALTAIVECKNPMAFAAAKRAIDEAPKS